MLSREDNELLTRVGPGTPAGELFRRFWHPVTTSARLGGPDGPQLRVRVLGENLIVFRDTNGDVGVLQAFCPHRRANLFWGRNEEGGLRCAYHGWKFDVSGQCIDMPTEPPASNYKEKLKAIGYPAVDKGGFIWAYLGPREQMPPLPAYEWMDLPDTHRVNTSMLNECNYLQGLEGDVDTAHVSYLHLYFDPEKGPQPPQFHENYRQYVIQDKSPKLTVKQTPYGFLYGGRRTLEDGSYYWRLTPWVAPSASQLPTTEKYGHAKINVPIDDYNHMPFSVMWSREGALGSNSQSDYRRKKASAPVVPFKLNTGHVIDHTREASNLDNDFLLDRSKQTSKFVGVGGGTGAEDRCVTESMGPILDRSEEHLGVSDIAIVAMRRALLRMIRDLRNGVEPALPHNSEAFHVRGMDIISQHADFEQLLAEHADYLLLSSAGARQE
ncbi:Rieske 2Fe-2S domain-containing protein [Phytohabitans flavus]|uniref:Ring-hydroxylating oxygenase subunit alpha n=1 Tax=Phytohabitans flavus TaxID=1076124 RepID=A0A6F8XVL6_9ACTN|nr:Rieske 2Fe-2S domain-containing protein [Phytohabitans flavus]BCB77884.1 ring-hydroxylating oxygenase subunit alpha [Phytohabitans flavus]